MRLLATVAAAAAARADVAASRRPAARTKTLVAILGNLRGGEVAWASLRRHVLEPNAADLALLLDEADPQNRPDASPLRLATYRWRHRELDDWAVALDALPGPPAGRVTWRALRDENATRRIFGGVKKVRGSGAIIFVLREWLARHIARLGLTERYDRFVITRSDHVYACPHVVRDLDPRYVWIPHGETQARRGVAASAGVTDRHVVASSRDVLRVLDVVRPLVRDPGRYLATYGRGRTGPKTRPDFNVERFLKLRLEETGLWPRVRFFDRQFFTVKAPGDSTRWAGARVSFPSGYGLKYPSEFRAARRTCGANATLAPELAGKAAGEKAAACAVGIGCRPAARPHLFD